MKTFLLTLLLCLPLLCAAQTATIKTNLRFTGMALANAETMMVLADNFDPFGGRTDGPSTVYLQKYHLVSGAKVWEKTLTTSRGTYNDQQGIRRTKDGGYLVNIRSYVFSSMYGRWDSYIQLIRVDQEGTILWNKIYNKGNDAQDLMAYAVNETSDGGFVVTGSKYPGIFVIKVNSQGEEEWRSELGPPNGSASAFYYARANNILQAKDGSYLVVGRERNGYIYGTNRYNEDILIIKVSPEGTEIWRKTLNEGGHDEAWAIAEAENGDFIVGGSIQKNAEYDVYTHQAFATRLTQKGESVWSKEIFGDTLTNEIRYLHLLDDNSIVAAGNYSQYKGRTGTNTCYKVSVDAMGNVTSSNTLLAGPQLFYFETTPLTEVAVGNNFFANEYIIKSGNGENSGGCNIQTSIAASGPLELCPGGSVTLSAGEGFASYKWSTGQTTRTITVSQAGQYKVEVTNEIGCPFATEAVTVTIKQPFAGDQICYVTVDKDTGKNKIMWNKTPGQNTVSYNIYKRAVGGNVKVASVAFDAAPSILDESSQPNSKTESYFIRAVDSCGNESAQMYEHKTVLLQASLGTSGEVNLTWNRYIGAAALKTVIYRGRDHNSLAPIAELTGQEDRYIDRNPVAEEKTYQIGIELNVSCGAEIPNGRAAAPMASALTRSNRLNLLVSGLNDDYESGSKLVSVWPNPVTQEATITVDSSQPKPATLQILDVTGRLVRQDAVSEHTIILKRNKLQAGVYIMAITLSNGNTLKKKIILR